MNKGFYLKFAASNIKKNSRTYIPYILTCIGTVMMYYIMYAMFENSRGFMNKPELGTILGLGVWVIAIFAVIFLFYTNSFLVKRRKKELGLLNILGMERKHISRMMAIETFYMAVISLVCGIGFGILFSKLIYLILLKLLHMDISLTLDISWPAILKTLMLYGAIFVLILLNTLRQIHLSKPIELLKGSQTGEKEPKTKWVIAILGIACLGTGYYIALTTKSPLSAINLFFVAVILVIIGTYLVFIAGSIAILKLLRKNKNYYYKTRHFTSVSGMIYRMKQNAAGLASICVLSTMVLVMVSTTVCLYSGMEDLLRSRFPRNIIVEGKNISSQQVEEIDSVIEKEISKAGASCKDVIKYRYMSLTAMQNGNVYYVPEDTENVSISNMAQLICIPLEDYNRIENTNEALGANQVLVYTLNGSLKDDALKFGDMEMSIKQHLESFNIGNREMALLVKTYYVIAPNAEAINNMYASLAGSQADDMGDLTYYYSFDTDAKGDKQIALGDSIDSSLKKLGVDMDVDAAESSRDMFYSLYGGLLFLGVFLGLLFIMATVLIIYYKQMSEGFDDRERFIIMQQVGMSRDEVKKSIRSQVLTVFFLPLAAAAIHVAFAFKFITKLLAVLYLTNVTLFAWCTVGCIVVFGIFYALVYSLTARTYYKLVS